MISKLKFTFALAFITTLITSCTQIPDGNGLLVIESDKDQYTIEEVYVWREGDSLPSIAWSNAKSNIDALHANIYLEPGRYRVKVKMCYNDIIYTYPSTGIATIEIKEDETKFLYVRDLCLYGL